MTNKFIIITNDSKKAILLKNKLFKILLKNKWTLDENNYDYVFVIGGDGTFLRSTHKYLDKKIIPINGGNLGYYSFFNGGNLKEILKHISKDENYIHPTMISGTIDNEKYFALNEIIVRGDTSLILDIKIDNIFYEKFRGTGLMFSTPLGSTAQSKSANGAVIYPQLDVIQLIEIEPISQKEYLSLKSPLILDSDVVIKIKCNFNCSVSSIIVDGHLEEKKFINSEMIIKSTKATFLLFNIKNKKVYLNKLKNSFMRG
ncbi:MAG: NAD(+)/NADH kinase [Malacoplasma sp.]